MSAHGITPRFASALQSLAQSQLQTQTSRSTGLDATAIGVMGVDAALAAVIVNVRPYHELWSIALALVGFSLGAAVRALLAKGAERAGPTVVGILRDREIRSDDELERWLIEDIAADMLINQRALGRKTRFVARALASVAAALVFIALVFEFGWVIG